MLGNQDAALKVQCFTKILLPHLESYRIGHGGESVIENDLLEFHGLILEVNSQHFLSRQIEEMLTES